MPERGERRWVPARMARVALVAPESSLRQMLVEVAASGNAELIGQLPAPEGTAVEALRRLQRNRGDAALAAPTLSEEPVEVEALEHERRGDLLTGEVELERRARASLRRAGFAVLVAWVPAGELAALSERLAGVGAAAVELRRPPLVEPPTLLRTPGLAGSFRGLVDTYGAARYADIDPTPFAAASFIVMFGMMFGDAGHGLLLVLLGLLLRRSRSPRLDAVRGLWPFAVCGGLAAAVFGLIYGEAFGPTGIVPTIWRKPLDRPVALLEIAVAVGALLLAVSYAVGVVNRWRESGPRGALLAPSGIAGVAVFAGGGLIAAGAYAATAALWIAGAVVVCGGMALLFAGYIAEASGSPGAIAQALIEVIDAVLRVAANLISFTRLAAFGLMHAALGSVIFSGTTSLWHSTLLGKLGAVLLFSVGNAAAFALEALVAGVQAMRLEYYELFSRVFAGEGEPFAPWRIPVIGQHLPA